MTKSLLLTAWLVQQVLAPRSLADGTVVRDRWTWSRHRTPELAARKMRKLQKTNPNSEFEIIPI